MIISELGLLAGFIGTLLGQSIPVSKSIVSKYKLIFKADFMAEVDLYRYFYVFFSSDLLLII